MKNENKADAEHSESSAWINPSSLDYIESLSETDLTTLPTSSDTTPSQKQTIQTFAEYGRHNFQTNNAGQITNTANVLDAKQFGVFQLIDGYRINGHLVADINPLENSAKKTHLSLTLSEYGLDEGDLDTVFDTGSFSALERGTLRQIIQALKETYCQTLGSEYMHISDPKEKHWLQHNIEPMRGKLAISDEEKKWLLQRLSVAETFEKFLHTKYTGQKRFSLEGGESLIPLLNTLFERAGSHYKTTQVKLGMAHRGRLNVLVNIFGKKPEQLFEEFSGELHLAEDQTGDVKYHMGFSSDIKTNKNDIHLSLAFNPSHLEIVNPVVQGYTRYYQELLNDTDGEMILPVLVHGDAAFAGQGVIMETLNMSQSRGYSTCGTLHIIVNNQIGFTTSNQNDARSTYYCTDVVKMINAPIFHVNAEDPEAVMFASQLAVDYRMKFKKDVVIDLMCYRRHGHNEADEPAVTQPIMYQKIRTLDTTRANYANTLIASNIITQADAHNMVEDYREQLRQGKRVGYNFIQPKKKRQSESDWAKYFGKHWSEPYDSTISKEKLIELNDKLSAIPKDFELHPIAKKTLADRQKMAKGEINADWGFAETMAYASLADMGISIRLSGQDSGRGTFFHRQAVLHNQKAVGAYVPLQHLHDKQGKVQVIDSVLSEEAVLGFEYGYASASPEGLVIWEAQFGDFVNGAQVLIDQFITSAETKWDRLSNLVMMLPHGAEGQGPEHSSGRLERFMQACARYNIQVCVPSTASQIFHLLRRQALRAYRKPLIIMTPKGLLRHKLAASPLYKLVEGSFKVVIREQYETIKPKSVTRVVLCSGKVFYDLLKRRQDDDINTVAILRIEQLYPFSRDDLIAELKKFPNAKEVVWCQEEPVNQGAWYTTRHNFVKCIGKNQQLLLVARRLSAVPAEGSLGLHNFYQNEIVEQALGIQPIIER